ncbi:hypothetical protein EON64_14130 [archaeon]|nr:MAG: hypothetical protein EON64_14130 [archaeon]
MIARVPPHWREGVVEERGNRWAGQGLTIDSCVTQGAPPRTVHGKPVPDMRVFYAKQHAEL